MFAVSVKQDDAAQVWRGSIELEEFRCLVDQG